MNPHRTMHRGCCALVAGLAIAASAALADTAAAPAPVRSTPPDVALADSGETTTRAPGSTKARSYPASEAGVRRAAAQGPEALRRYIWRTRMIYNYWFWDFVERP
ncbi:MAG: hypothetical protein ACREYB_02940 [Casimicrobiaceae bacterium]